MHKIHPPPGQHTGIRGLLPITLLFTLFTVSICFTACSGKEQAARKAKADSTQTQLLHLETDRLSDQDEVKTYCAQMVRKLGQNAQTIADLKAEATDKRPQEIAGFNPRLQEVESRNMALQKMVKVYSYNGKKNWNTFKITFSENMVALDQALEELKNWWN